MKIDVAKHISSLLYENDKVIIPDLGTFLTIQKPTELNKFQELSPTTKEVIFDKKFEQGDNFLAQSISNQYQISEAEAAKIVENYVLEVKYGLSQGAVSVSNIGRFFLDKNKIITFASSNTNFSKNSFGLPKLGYTPLNRKSEAKAVVAVEVDEKIERKGFKEVIYSLWADTNIRAIVLICVLVLIVFQVAKFVNDDSEIVVPSIIENNDDLIDVETNLDPYEKTIDNTPIIITETEIETDSEVDSNAERLINQKPQSTTQVEALEETIDEKLPKKQLNRKDYIIIIGNFSTEENANIGAKQVKEAGYIAYFKKVNAEKYRVGISLKISSDELDTKLQTIKEIFPDAWVMNR